MRSLSARGHTNLITRTRAELDLTNQAAVNEFFAPEQPDVVFLAGAKVGGIMANKTYTATTAVGSCWAPPGEATRSS